MLHASSRLPVGKELQLNQRHFFPLLHWEFSSSLFDEWRYCRTSPFAHESKGRMQIPESVFTYIPLVTVLSNHFYRLLFLLPGVARPFIPEFLSDDSRKTLQGKLTNMRLMVSY